MARPRVDVVVPFRGTQQARANLLNHLHALQLEAGDTMLVVDNTPGADELDGPIPVIVAAERPTPGYARNRGAERGRNEWLIFIDADTDPARDLLKRYFDPPPESATALMAGGIRDEEVPADAPGPARYAYLRRTLSQDRTLSDTRFAFAQTANVACKRSAFEAVGGFREDIRAGEDADLSFRLRAAGGQIERREQAMVVHRNRTTLAAFVAQAALHGAGSAWVERHYPGAFPPRRRAGLLWWALRTAASGAVGAARSRDRDVLVKGLYEPLWEVAFELGRSRSVEAQAAPDNLARR